METPANRQSRDFSDLLRVSGERMLALYDVSRDDVALAERILKIQFETRKVNRERIIILPQIADWLWHEAILDTFAYEGVCDALLGFKLEHLQIEPDEFGFEDSCRWLSDEWGIRLPRGWFSAGWATPTYRFRATWAQTLGQFSRDAREHLGETRWEELVSYESPVDLQWLKDRVQLRFGISATWARLAVAIYSRFLSSIQTGEDASDYLQCSLLWWAWQEHVLWTKRYAADCNELLGSFLHHKSPPVTDLFSDLNGVHDLVTKEEFLRVAA